MIASLLSLLSVGGLSCLPISASGPMNASVPHGIGASSSKVVRSTTLATTGAPAFHSIAFVTDPMSHGVVGDGLLSLNEAIQLHNGTLALAQLSAAEQLQTSLLPGSGGTTDVTWIEIDAELTPTITIEQDLDSIVNTPFGLFIRGSGGKPVLDFGGAGITRGLHSTSANLILQDLHLKNGPYGLELQQPDVTGQPGCTLSGLILEDHTQFGLRVVGAVPNAIGRLILEDTRFDNIPSAIEFDETLSGRTTIFEARGLRVTGAVDALDLAIGGGGNARFTFDSVVIECSGTGIALDAPATGGRPTLIEGDHTRVRAAVCAQIDGSDDAVTWMQCAMWNLLANAGGTAFELGGLGNQVYGDLNEFRCVGDVAIGTGGTVLPLQVRNMRSADGVVTFATTATQALDITESRFVDCVTDSVGSGPVAIVDSSFEGGSLGSASSSGALQASGCYIANAGVGVTATQALTQPHLGSMEVVPDDVAMGGSIQFQADLPPGLVCAFLLGNVPSAPPVVPAPYYVYLDPLGFVFLPGLYSGQQTTSWTAPSLPQFRGYPLIVQAVVLPTSGVVAPALQFPPGWRFTLN